MDLARRDSFILFILRSDLRLGALVLAILVFALLGSPTPDVIELPIYIIGALLVCAIGPSGFARVLNISIQRPGWFYAGQIFVIYGVMAGIAGALIQGADVMPIMRDLLPFGFLFLPLFLFSFYTHKRFSKVLLCAYVLLGVGFSLRVIAPRFEWLGSFDTDALYYLGNSPAVLFTALFCFGGGVLRLSRGLSGINVLQSIALFLICVLTLCPIVLGLQRASFGAFILYMIVTCGILFMRHPRRMSVVAAALIAAIWVFFNDMLLQSYDALTAKNALVGANMRLEEWGAVWEEISAHPVTLMFGAGWGASFTSPAVADIDVYYTHSLLSGMLLKLGVCGFVLCFIYIGFLFLKALEKLNAKPMLVMAVIAPLFIDTFLYAAHKSLGFGLLLAIIPVLFVADKDGREYSFE